MTILATPPNLIGQPTVGLFQKEDFEALIWNKGYSVIVEKAIQCPCKGKSGSPKTTCQNCLGLGWVFISPLETKALVTSANSQTKYKFWSPELTGTVNITVRDEERLAFYDKITFVNNFSLLSEVREVIEDGEGDDLVRFIFTSYNVDTITDAFYFEDDEETLVRIPVSKLSVKAENKSVISISSDVTFPDDFNGVITIRYKHEISYNVVDIPHDFRSTFIYNSKGQNVEHNMPIQAVAQRSHLVIGESTNYEGTNLLTNE